MAWSTVPMSPPVKVTTVKFAPSSPYEVLSILVRVIRPSFILILDTVTLNTMIYFDPRHRRKQLCVVKGTMVVNGY